MAGVLPTLTTDEELTAFKGTPGAERRALQAVARHAGLATDSLAVFPVGSAVVGSAGNTVIKLFAPFDGQLATAEGRVLALLAGRLSCPTPTLRGEGELDGWPYLLMSRLAGVPLASVWDTLSTDRRRAVCEKVGRLAAQLHALDPTPVADLPPHWPSFFAEQRDDAVHRQRVRGLDEPWLRQIEPFLGGLTFPESPPVLLHTELMRAHVFVDPDTLQLTGLLDFEPSMVGSAGYELASVGLFITSGEPSLFGAFLDGYGVEHTAELARRCLGFTLLHRYAHLPWYTTFMPMEGVDSLEAMAARWWCP